MWLDAVRMTAVCAVQLEKAQPPSMLEKQMKAKAKAEKKAAEGPATETSPVPTQPAQSLEGRSADVTLLPAALESDARRVSTAPRCDDASCLNLLSTRMTAATKDGSTLFSRE